MTSEVFWVDSTFQARSDGIYNNVQIIRSNHTNTTYICYMYIFAYIYIYILLYIYISEAHIRIYTHTNTHLTTQKVTEHLQYKAS